MKPSFLSKLNDPAIRRCWRCGNLFKLDPSLSPVNYCAGCLKDNRAARTEINAPDGVTDLEVQIPLKGERL